MATASLLPLPRAVFYSPNGHPLAEGFVYTYVPGGTTFKTTWQDAGEATPNTNPIRLDAAGSCLLYGSGSYQITVTDRHGNDVPAYSGLTTTFGSPSSFTTIASLRANNSAVADPGIVYVSGYYAIADGGEGNFVYNPADTSSADNGGTIIVDAFGNRWYRETNGTAINPLWFGCFADGSTDNGATWANVEAVSVATGRPVDFPAGKFSFATAASYTLLSMSASAAITGAGPGLTQLIFPSGGGLTVNCVAGPGSASFNNVTVAGLSITTGTTNTGTGLAIVMTGSSGGRPSEGVVSLRDLDIRGSDGPSLTNYWATGLEINGMSNVTVVGCMVNGAGITAGGGTGMNVFGTADNIPTVINVNSCEFYNTLTGFIYGPYTQGVTIYQSNFTGGTVGIQTPSGLPTPGVQLVIDGCQFETNAANGTQIVMNSIIADLIIRNNLLFVTGVDGIALNLSERTTIEGNHIEAVAGATGSGIFIQSVTSDGGMISGNFITGFLNGIALGTGTTLINVQSNYYRFNTVDVSDNGSGNTIGGGSE